MLNIRIRRQFLGVAAVAAAILIGLSGGCGGDDLTGVSGPLANLEILSGQDQSGQAGAELLTPLTIKALDDQGRVIKGQIVNFKVTAGGGSVFAGSASTDENGIAKERWTLGTVAGDTQRVEVRAVDPKTGEPIVFGRFTAVATPAAAAKVVVLAALDYPRAAPGTPLLDSLAVKVVDQYDNIIPGAPVTWTVVTGGGSIAPGSPTTSAVGVVRAKWTLGTGAQTATASVPTPGSTPASFSTYSSTPSQLKLVGGATDGIVGSAVAPPIVRAVDSHSDEVSGVTVTFAVKSGGGSITGATQVTQARAEATLGGLTLGTAAVVNEITATAVGVTPLTIKVTANAGPAAKLAFSSPVPTVGWSTIISPAVSVGVTDQFGNATTGNATVTLTLSANPAGAALFNGSATMTAGVATFPKLMLDAPGAGYVLTASASGLASGSSNTFSVDAIGSFKDPALGLFPRGLAVADGFVYVAKSVSGGSNCCSLVRAPVTGGTFASVGNGYAQMTPSRLAAAGGRIDGVDLLGWIPAAPTPDLRAIVAGVEVWPTGWNYPGADLESDGTYYYVAFAVNPEFFSGMGAPFPSPRGIVRIDPVKKERLTLFQSSFMPRFSGPFAIADGTLYFIEPDSASGLTVIRALPMSGGVPTTVVSGLGPMNIPATRLMTVTGGMIYWLEKGAGGPTDGSIKGVSIGGGTITTFATGIRGAYRMTGDGTNLYVVESTGIPSQGAALVRYRLSDFARTTIDAANVIDVVIAGDLVVWSKNDGTGTIRKMRR